MQSKHLKHIIQNILNEEVHENKVIQAIKKRHTVSFKYDDNDGGNKGKDERITVLPVEYGITSKGNMYFRAFQINGSSKRYEMGGLRPLPGWRKFLLHRVVDGTWKDNKKTFKEPPLYNPNSEGNRGDKVLLRADFVGTKERYQRGGLERFNTERHTSKIAQNPYYDLEKQLGRKQETPQFVKQNIKNTKPKGKDYWEIYDKMANKYQEQPKGNLSSIEDMSRQKDFGNNNETQTNEPIRKGEEEPIVQTNPTKPADYKLAVQNGPIYKNEKDENNEKIEK